MLDDSAVEQYKKEVKKVYTRKRSIDEAIEDYERAKPRKKQETFKRLADQERQRQKKECEVVVNERDILGTQLIRRNDELALLYEKMKTQQRTISKVFGASKATARAPSRARLGQAPTPAAAGGTCVP